MRLTYNAPFTLTLALLATVVLIADRALQGMLAVQLFSVPPVFDSGNVVHYLRLLLFPLGHADGTHLTLNLSVILLVGPLLEEKHGAARLLGLSLATTLITAVAHLLLFPGTGLLGASGIAFLLIVLGSFTNVRRGTIPLTFVLVALLFLGHELTQRQTGISTLAHLLGGAAGGLYGLRLTLDPPRRGSR